MSLFLKDCKLAFQQRQACCQQFYKHHIMLLHQLFDDIEDIMIFQNADFFLMISNFSGLFSGVINKVLRKYEFEKIKVLSLYFMLYALNKHQKLR